MEPIECRATIKLKRIIAVVVGVLVILAIVNVVFVEGSPAWPTAVVAGLLVIQAWLAHRSLLRVDDAGVVRRAVATKRCSWEQMGAVEVREDTMTSFNLSAPMSVVTLDGDRIPLTGQGSQECLAALREAVVAEATPRGIEVRGGKAAGL